MTKKAPAAATGAIANWATVNLESGFQRGEETITQIRLRKPKAGELRGLNLQELFGGDVNAVIAVLPRISDPIMTAHDAENLEAEDLIECAGTIRTFFMNKIIKQQLDLMTSAS